MDYVTYSSSGSTVLIKDLETIATTVIYSLTIHFSDSLCSFSEIIYVSHTKF